MATQFVKSERLRKLPPYLFAEIDKKKKAAIAAGRDVINLGVGDPDRPTPPSIIKSLQHHVENPAFHQYALDQGSPELRRSIAAFCKKRYGLDLDPETEILALIGSKEGIAHLPLAVLNPGDISLVPTPVIPSIAPAACSSAPTSIPCRWSLSSAFAPISTPSPPMSMRWPG